MSGISEEETRAIFMKRVAWLRNNIAPDDIYEFAEQALTCADCFLRKWNEWEDVGKEVDKKTYAGRWVKNLVWLRILEKQGYMGGINVNMTKSEEK